MHQSANLISFCWLLAIAQLWFQITLAKSACDKGVGTLVIQSSATYIGISWRFHKFQPSQDVVVRKPFRALGSRTLWSFPLWPRDLLDWPNQTLGKIGDAKLWMSKDLNLVETLLHSTGPMESHGRTTSELRITYNGPFQYDTRWSNPGSIWFSFVM